MKEIPEPQLTFYLQELDRTDYDPMAFIEFVGGTAFWLEGNKPGQRKVKPEERQQDETNTNL